MMWLADNIGTIAAVGILVLILAAAELAVFRNKKKGKSNCGCGCSHCAMKDACGNSESKR